MMVVCGERAAEDRVRLAALALGALEDGGEAGALGGGEVGLHLGAVVIGEDGDLVVGGEGSLQRAEGVVDLVMVSKGTLWSMTRATESGKGSTVKMASCWRTLFS